MEGGWPQPPFDGKMSLTKRHSGQAHAAARCLNDEGQERCQASPSGSALLHIHIERLTFCECRRILKRTIEYEKLKAVAAYRPNMPPASRSGITIDSLYSPRVGT